jgi:hypothetical protein
LSRERIVVRYQDFHHSEAGLWKGPGSVVTALSESIAKPWRMD